MKTDDYYEIKSHEPLDSDCICPTCICQLNTISVLDLAKDEIKDKICTHEDDWGPTILIGDICFLCHQHTGLFVQ